MNEPLNWCSAPKAKQLSWLCFWAQKLEKVGSHLSKAEKDKTQFPRQAEDRRCFWVQWGSRYVLFPL